MRQGAGSTRRITLIVSLNMHSRVEEVRNMMGFIDMSDAYRYVLAKGLDAIEKEIRTKGAKTGSAEGGV